MRDRWVAFYSQTGSEIKKLVLDGYVPDLVVTDNFSSYLKNYEFFKDHDVEQIIRMFEGSKRDRIDDYNRLLYRDDLITLHGWLNIVPGVVCESYTIYNGHPGHIVEYPELKGKDPQERVWENILSNEIPEKIGSVVHRVTEEIDGGEVVVVAEMPLDNRIHIGSLEGMFDVSGYLSKVSWDYFFRNLDKILQEDLNLDGTSDRDQHIPVISVNHELNV